MLGKVMVTAREAAERGESLDWTDGALAPLHIELLDAVEAGERSRDSELSGLCGKVLDIWPALWSFTQIPGVEATNNVAERAIRHAVLWRKCSGGTGSAEGERFVERLLSMRETCRLQDRPLHGYLVEVHRARLGGGMIPSPLDAAA